MKDFTDSFQIYTSLLIIYKSDEFPKIMKAFLRVMILIHLFTNT